MGGSLKSMTFLVRTGRGSGRRTVLLCGMLLAGSLCGVAGAQVAIKGKTVHTMAGEKITAGVVVITGGKIAAVGPQGSTPIPAGYEVLEAEVVTPGLVDPRGTAGLTGIYNGPHDSDQLENSSAIQPELRALDAYNPQERLVQWLREFGVTTLHTGHAPGKLISGQTIIVKTTGNTVEEALVRSPAMISATLGPQANEPGGKSPGTRGKQVAMLREELLRAKEFIEKRAKAGEKASAKDDGKAADAKPGEKPAVKDPKRPAETPAAISGVTGAEAKPAATAAPTPPDRNLHTEMLADVLDGKVPLLICANRAQDIESALRLKEEFGFKLILESGAEAYLLLEQVKAAGVDVIVHPSMQRAVGDAENQTFENAARLHAAGIRVAIESGYEDYVPKSRVVLLEAAIAAANGLTFDQALATITIDAARILGVDARVGSLAAGKDGDVAMYDGDPFEYTSHCVGVVIDGKVVSREKR